MMNISKNVFWFIESHVKLLDFISEFLQQRLEHPKVYRILFPKYVKYTAAQLLINACTGHD